EVGRIDALGGREGSATAALSQTATTTVIEPPPAVHAHRRSGRNREPASERDGEPRPKCDRATPHPISSTARAALRPSVLKAPQDIARKR
ncbi:MAG: hypothetical protein AAFN74_10080, partial [Myxococcota bacterium]